MSANSIHSSFYFSAFIFIFVSGMYQTAYRNVRAMQLTALAPVRTIPQEPRCRENKQRVSNALTNTHPSEDALYNPANWTISTSISKEKVSPLRIDDRDDWETTVTSVRCAAGSSRDKKEGRDEDEKGRRGGERGYRRCLR